MTYKLAASAEMIFLDLPFIERVKKINDAGFLVEIWNWANKDLEALAKSGATFSSMTGYLEGDLISDDGADELIGAPVAVKEAVLPFGRFTGVDSVLGPEMKSTGEGIRFIKDLKDPFFRQVYSERNLYLSK